MSSEKDREGAPAASDPATHREFIHQCNNLLGGILNGVALLRRARNEKDREEAIALIEDAACRAQEHLHTLGQQGAPGAGSSRPPAECPAPAENAPKRTVLVAEDDDLNRHLLRKLLESTGRYTVDEAVDGREAVEHYRRQPPDLVVLDIAMPGLGGPEVLERLRRIDRKAKVLLVSGYIDPRDPIVREPNVVGFLQKPVEPEALFEKIAHALAAVS